MGINLVRDGDSSRQILDEIRRLVRFLRISARAAEKELGISGAQLFILQTLDKSEGPLSVNELAELTRTHQSSVSVVVHKLVLARLVRRARDRRDARQLALTITPAARTLLRRSPNSAQEQLITATERMTRRQQEDLSQLLARLNTELGLDREKPPLLFFEDDTTGSNNNSDTKRKLARR